MQVRFILLILFASCSSLKPNSNYIKSSEYTERESIKQDFLKADDRHLSEHEIDSLLKKKIEFKEQLKMAVFYQSPRSFFKVTKEREKIFLPSTDRKSRIFDIQFIPSLLTPPTPELKKLRDLAALMQADLLLIVQSQDITKFKFHLLTKNETKAVVSLEALVMDVRSGAIPYATRATQAALIEDEKEDFSREEFVTKATLAAEDMALQEIMQGLTAYFQ